MRLFFSLPSVLCEVHPESSAYFSTLEDDWSIYDLIIFFATYSEIKHVYGCFYTLVKTFHVKIIHCRKGFSGFLFSELKRRFKLLFCSR